MFLMRPRFIDAMRKQRHSLSTAKRKTAASASAITLERI